VAVRVSLVALALTLLPASAGAVKGPVAVMPFKNLAGARDLAWLELGIAETLVADLRKSNAVTVVERDQLDRALREIQLQGAPASDVSEAVSAGKLVGAKTIVLGGYQRAGKKLRITARFVAVETGVVLDTAKVTGRLERVFALQDQLVDRLLGKKKPARKRKKKRAPAKPATIEAYRLYSLSLDARDDDERASILRRSLAADPAFVYSLEDLRRLERRVRGLDDSATGAQEKTDERLLALVHADATPAAERDKAARALLERMLAQRRYYALQREAPRVYALGLARELASWGSFLAHVRLRRLDEALQLGERYLEEHRDGARYADVKKAINDVIEERRARPTQRREYDEELRDNERDRREHTTGGRLDPDYVVSVDYKPCIAAKWSRLPREMIDNCGRFVAKYRASADAEARDFVRDARAFVVWGHALRGEFPQARALADELARDDPGQLGEIGLQEIIDTRWPTDAPAGR
jgi:TolB-like protein